MSIFKLNNLKRKVRLMYLFLSFVAINISPFISKGRLITTGIIFFFIMMIFYCEIDMYEKRDFTKFKESYSVLAVYVIMAVGVVYILDLIKSINSVVDILIILISVVTFFLSFIQTVDPTIIMVASNIKDLENETGVKIINLWNSMIIRDSRKSSKEYSISLMDKNIKFKEGLYFIYDYNRPDHITEQDIIGSAIVLKDPHTNNNSKENQVYNIKIFDIFGKIPKEELSSIFNNQSKEMIIIKVMDRTDYEDAKNKNDSISIDINKDNGDIENDNIIL